MWASDAASQISGWALVGSWTAAAGPANLPPTADSVTPSSGSGSGAVFSYQVSDSEGYADVTSVAIIANETFTISNSCYMFYAPSSNRLFLRNDAGTAWLPQMEVGVAGTLANSQCSIDMGASSVTTVGNTLTLDLDLQFLQTGDKTQWLWTIDTLSQTSGWVSLGTWEATN